LASLALKVAGTGNVATVQDPAVPAGQPVSVALDAKVARFPVSASAAWLTVVVPMPLSNEASTASAAEEEVLQSNMTLVAPPVTPTINEPTTVPGPLAIVTVQGALEPEAWAAIVAEAMAPGSTARPVNVSSIVRADATSEVRTRRPARCSLVGLLVFLIDCLR
jgi:hypothetical protein